MIWFLLGLVAVAALLPLVLVLRGSADPRARRDAALVLHRQQLLELDADLAQGRLSAADHAGAVLEVQRRLLAADADHGRDAPAGTRPSTPVLWVIVAAPFAALGLYLVGGSPAVPSIPQEVRQAAAQRAAEADLLIGRLRERLATLDPKTDQAREGFVLLGNVEEARGRWGAAAAAWERALVVRFDATLAARTAEAASREAGRVTPEAALLFRRALDAAPADAPWRSLVQQRLAEAPS